jgi:hypothetical protein
MSASYAVMASPVVEEEGSRPDGPRVPACTADLALRVLGAHPDRSAPRSAAATAFADGDVGRRVRRCDQVVRHDAQVAQAVVGLVLVLVHRDLPGEIDSAFLEVDKTR